MKVELKYVPEDEVFVMYKNRVQKARIYTARFEITRNGKSIVYSFEGLPLALNENEVFETKEKLLESL